MHEGERDPDMSGRARVRACFLGIARVCPGLALLVVGCDRDAPTEAFDHRVSAERHWSAGESGATAGEGVSARVQDLWPSPASIDEAVIARLDSLRVQSERVRALRSDRAARLAAEGVSDPGSDPGSQVEAQRALLARLAGAELAFDADELELLRRLGEGRALQQDWLWRMGDPDGDGVVNPEAADGFLRYLEDGGSAEQQRMLMEFDVSGDGVLSPAERAAAEEGLRREVRDFERLQGVDIDLDGAVSANEMELFLRRFQRGDSLADLDGDGRLGADDLSRFEHAIAG